MVSSSCAMIIGMLRCNFSHTRKVLLYRGRLCLFPMIYNQQFFLNWRFCVNCYFSLYPLPWREKPFAGTLSHQLLRCLGRFNLGLIQQVVPTGESSSNSKQGTGALQNVFYNISATKKSPINLMKAEDTGFLFHGCISTRFFSHLFNMVLSLELQLLEFSDEVIVLAGI